MKQLICITGMDGSGKSTLLRSLKKTYTNAYFAGIWDLLNEPEKQFLFNSKKDIDNFLCELTPDSRLLFLAHALRYSIDKALMSEAELIFIDSYYYKYFAGEMALGANENLIESLIDSFPEPDLLIELYFTVNEAALRKQHFSRYECGTSKETSIKTFTEFQLKAEVFWNMFPHEKREKINARLMPEDVLKQTNLLINDFLRK